MRLARRIANNERHQRLLGKQMLAKYAHLAATSYDSNTINDFEIAVHSQNGEDGILLHLFSKIGSQDHRFVEFGVGDGVQCNAANLALNFSWQGLLIEGNRRQARKAKNYYQRRVQPPGRVTVRCQTVTAANINQILLEEGIEGEMDLLSIDIDGNDYWVWRAITAIQPRVVVIEYNASLGPERALVVEYDEKSDHRSKHYSGYYHGASLLALDRLATEKGYVLVGCESAGVNAFFVRQDLAAGSVVPVSPQEAYFPHSIRTRHRSLEEQWRLVEGMPFVEV